MNRILILFVIIFCTFTICGYGQSKLSLQEALETGLKHNPEIKRSMENVNAAAGRFWEGISFSQPEIGLVYEYVPDNSRLNNFGEKTFEVRQSFEFPTNYFLRGKKYNLEKSIATHQLTLTERKVVNLIKNSYFKVLAQQQRIKVAEENSVISKEFYTKAEIRQNVGEGTNLERLTAKVQYTESQNRLEVLKNEIALAKAELQYALGFGQPRYEADFILTDSLVFVDHKKSLEEISGSIEKIIPQIMIAQSNQGIASMEKSLAWSSFLPTFDLAYFKQTRDGDSGFYGASFGITVPLWFMFNQRGKIQEARAHYAIAESELYSAWNEMDLKLKRVLTEYENTLQQVKLYIHELLPQAEEIHRIAMKSYESGELTYLEYLQAKQTLINTRDNYIDTLFNYYRSIFQIEELTGQIVIGRTERIN